MWKKMYFLGEIGAVVYRLRKVWQISTTPRRYGTPALLAWLTGRASSHVHPHESPSYGSLEFTSFDLPVRRTGGSGGFPVGSVELYAMPMWLLSCTLFSVCVYRECKCVWTNLRRPFSPSTNKFKTWIARRFTLSGNGTGAKISW